MKYSINHLKNISKRFINEQTRLIKLKLNKKWKSFLSKGHEKLTILFIPHNESKIFNFQISKFTILFIILLICTLITTSAFSFKNNNQSVNEKESTMADYKKLLDELKEYQELTSDINSMIGEISPQIDSVYSAATGDTGPHSKNSKKSALSFFESLPHSIDSIKERRNILERATSQLQTVNTFIQEEERVINETPSSIPVQGNITSLYGWRKSPFGAKPDFHPGIDIAAPAGIPVRATAPGTVITSGWSGGYGKLVSIRHKYGFVSYYGHNSRLAVRVGEEVKKGEIIAYVGTTGLSTGNHCHYELRLGNSTINPYPYMSRTW